MKVLNLYAGIGGNRKLWPQFVKVTAVENNRDIARIYAGFFPEDEIIIGDAHRFLLENFRSFDFIWSSPPCPTHSDVRRLGVVIGQYEAKYPDMTLYQEIILLKTFFQGLWCVENVVPYYKPLIPALKRDRHLFWSNFYIPEFQKSKAKHHKGLKEQQNITGFNLSSYKGIEKRKILRNCVYPELGKWIFEAALRQEKTLC